MAALALDAIGLVLYTDGSCERITLYALKRVTAGDTIDLSRDFNAPRLAVVVGATVVGALVATISGNSVVMPAGLANDGAYVLVWGVHA